MRYRINALVATGFIFALSTMLTGCFLSATPGASSPTATAVASRATSSPAPSTGNSQPTSQPTSVPGAGNPQPTSRPTSAPAVQPTIDFQPRGGAAGTTVAARGWGFPANRRVAVRIGLPQAVGEVLSSAQTDASGTWSAQVIIPDRLPSGEPITTTDMRIVAMDEQNQPLASAPFAFTPSSVPTEGQPIYGFANDAKEATKYLLDALLHYPNGKEAFAYVSPTLFQHYGQGPAINILQLQNPFRSYTIDGVVASGGTGVTVRATLDSVTPLHFVAITDAGGGFWVVNAVLPAPANTADQPGDAGEAVQWLWPQDVPPELSVLPDGQGSFANEAMWVLQLAQPHVTEPDVTISGGLGRDGLGSLSKEVTVRGQPGRAFPNGTGHTVFWSEGNQPYFISGNRSLEELLRIADSLQAIDRASWQQRIQLQ